VDEIQRNDRQWRASPFAVCRVPPYCRLYQYAPLVLGTTCTTSPSYSTHCHRLQYLHSPHTQRANMLRNPSMNRCVSAAIRWQPSTATTPPMSRLAVPQSSLSSSFPPPQDVGAIRYRSNRSRRGLYDGKDIRTGNNVSFSMRATKRTFKPNVFKKRVYSEVLDEMIRFHLTTSTLRSIDKAGGLDNYLLTSKHVENGGEGQVVKERILSKLAFEDRQTAREAAQAGGATTTLN
jgi:large subunit ribosomal protein L28